ncbi:LPS assembly lipoprotein LptE [Caldovatus aquaticus]|uniref:LPS-assembly lipoprotein n=1 Tax=Caldovatus aquaticus TaxID=2865671 RepID=A0ABS7F5X2_9PROT|nr:LPS assembly lipoprotein LptE [Caldovatus aquaticus]MBW8270959.1 hypothetical protein [Caldovatus aquaticus]
MSRAGWSISSSRAARGRRVLLRRGAVAAALLLPGCGFRPLYGPGGGAAAGEEAPVQAELAAVQVAPIPERGGQLLRRALAERLRGAAQAAPARYDLRVSLAFAAEPLGFRRDGTPSRVRYQGTASWWLLTRTAPPQQIASGTERENDAYNIPDQQFFAAEAARDAAERRMVEQLAFAIAERLALVFRQRAEAAARSAAAPSPAGGGRG